jgi:RNA-directed DNA polymerase
VGIETRASKRGRDADIRGVLDTIDHAWRVQFIEQRIGDRRVVRQRRQWLQAGVLEDGPWWVLEAGTPQGGHVSPVAATSSRHDVLALWAERWRRHALGDRLLGCYGADCLAVCEHQDAAERCWTELRARVQQFNLERHPGKTRRLEVGRLAAARRKHAHWPIPQQRAWLGRVLRGQYRYDGAPPRQPARGVA